jgi:hypothetical protein
VRRRFHLASLVPVAILAGLAALLVHRDRAERERWRAEEEARVGSRRARLARGCLGETLALCREGWTGQLGLHHQPVALAWSRRGIDAYFHQGTDAASLRHVRCSAEGVSLGPRVAHPLHASLPAEAPARPEGRDEEAWARALDAASLGSLAEGELAVEMLRHPVTGAALARRWHAGPEGAFAVLDPPGSPSFALLLGSPDFRPVSPASPGRLEPQPRRHWLREPDAAFSLLARELPAGASVAELTLEDDRIGVSIAWPTPAFDGKPPAPYGDKTFDEYGVADVSWWYPREAPGFGCPRGEPLGRVHSAFAAARARLAGQALSRAWYSCSPSFSNGHEGTWHLVAR